MMLDEMVFECFDSHAVVNGRRVRIGTKESARLKRRAVFRGFTDVRGRPRKRLKWTERLVIVLRETTSAEAFNHEWWAAEASKPKWARRLDECYRNGWLHYPANTKDMSAKSLGARIGYSLTLAERQMGQAARYPAFRKKLEAADLEKARRSMDDDLAKTVRVVLPGYESWREFAEEAFSSTKAFRQMLFSFVGEQELKEQQQFIVGFSEGQSSAMAADLISRLSEFHEQREVVEILSNYWDVVDSLKTRTEIYEFIRDNLPKRMQKVLAQKKGVEKNESWQSAMSRWRDICRKIGLNPARKGRPKVKMGKS